MFYIHNHDEDVLGRNDLWTLLDWNLHYVNCRLEISGLDGSMFQVGQ